MRHLQRRRHIGTARRHTNCMRRSANGNGTVIVGPGQSLIAAAADGLILPADAAAGMERGKAFEEEVRRRYRINME